MRTLNGAILYLDAPAVTSLVISLVKLRVTRHVTLVDCGLKRKNFYSYHELFSVKICIDKKSADKEDG